MKTKNKIIYHNADIDGFVSGAICKLAYPEFELVGVNYGDPMPELGPINFIVDFSFPMEDMIRESYKIIWIDHHKSAIEEHERLGGNIRGLRRISKSAAYLCFEFLGKNIEFQKFHKNPLFLDLVSAYDTWNHSEIISMNHRFQWRDIVASQYSFRFHLEDPARSMASYLDFLSDRDFLIENMSVGYNLLSYQESLDERASKRCTTLKKFDMNLLVLNAEGSSDTVASVVSPEHDAILLFKKDKDSWRYSLYRTEGSNADILSVAKSLGGGGHPGACGFESKKLLEWL